tara:strand:- start:505 stop:639 length:135 start_codon:yes stop_codon:yes gene_type:complete
MARSGGGSWWWVLHRNLCYDWFPVFFIGNFGDSHETLHGLINIQ